MTNISKFIALILLGLSLSYCAKKTEDTPAPDYISGLTGTYSGTYLGSFYGYSITSAVVNKVDNNTASVTILTSTSTYGLNMVYSTNVTSGNISLTYFTIPTTSSTSFSAYGGTYDYYTLDNVIQNAYISKTTSGSSSYSTLYITAKGNDGKSLTGTTTK